MEVSIGEVGGVVNQGMESGWLGQCDEHLTVSVDGGRTIRAEVGSCGVRG